MKLKLFVSPAKLFADVMGDNYTKSITPTPVNKLARGKLDGKVRVHTDEYEASALASGSTISIGKTLNTGDIIKDIKIFFDALGASSTLAVGDSADADRYIAAASSASAGSIVLNQIAGANYVIGTNSGDSTILITTDGAEITGTIKSQIEYLAE